MRNKSYIKTYVREAYLRLAYVLFSWLLSLFCCYLKSTQIIYLIIKFTLSSAAISQAQLTQESHATLDKKNPLYEKSLFTYQPAVSQQNSPGKGHGQLRQFFAEFANLKHTQGGELQAKDEITEASATCPAYDFIYTNVTEAFYAALEAAITFSMIFTLPLLIYQSWCFLMPSRYYRERIYFNKCTRQLLLYVTFFLWLIIWWLLPHISEFLHLFAVQRGRLEIKNQARIAPYLSWVFSLVLTLTMASLTPLSIYLSLKKGWLSKSFLIENRRTTAYFLLIFAAAVSPPDLGSQLTISFCLFVFFECVIWFYLYDIKT